MFIAFSPSVIFQKKNDSSLVRGSLNMRLSVKLILYEICCRQPPTVTNNYILYYIVGANCVRPFLIRCELAGDRRSPLRFNVFFNLTTPDHHHISDNSLGRSKPLPYHVVVCFVSFATAFGCLSLPTQRLLFRKNHALLACSVVNALTTARCRYQLLRIANRRIVEG